MTVLEVIQRSTEWLTRKGVESPRLQTELLLAHLLRLPRMQLYLNFERKLSENEQQAFRELVQRRGAREPLQHIVGSTNFCGLEIGVSRAALVPRPETELLAERGWQFLNAVPAEPARPPTALDFGTGTGCLALALASHCASAEIQALDISAAALELAGQNADRLGLSQRVRFLHGDGWTPLAPGSRFHLILSNPPYIPDAEIATLEPEVRDHDPREALAGGPDGLDYYRRLAAGAAPFLEPSGKIMLEFGDGQAESVRGIFQEQNWVVESVVEDYNRRPRILIAHG